MKDPAYKKEYETLLRKYSIPEGETLKKMLSTETGRKRYSERTRKWERFKEKWGIVFFIKHKPVFRTASKKVDPKNK